MACSALRRRGKNFKISDFAGEFLQLGPAQGMGTLASTRPAFLGKNSHFTSGSLMSDPPGMHFDALWSVNDSNRVSNGGSPAAPAASCRACSEGGGGGAIEIIPALLIVSRATLPGRASPVRSGPLRPAQPEFYYRSD